MQGRLDRTLAVILRGGLAAALLLLVAGLSVATSRTTAQEAGQADASVRFVHALPGGPAVDIVVDGTPVAPGVAFGAATEYASLPGGDHAVQVLPTGETAPLVDTGVTLEAGGAYIVTVLGTVDAPTAQVNQVNVDETTEGQARARLLNAVPDGGALNVGIAGGETLFDGVDFQATSDYRDVAPGTYDMAISLPDGDAPVATVPGVELTEGTVYDVIALGEVGGGTVTLLPLSTTVSQPCGEILEIGTADDACVRYVHAAAGSAEVDIYVGGQVSVPGITFASSTEFVAIPAGDQQFQVTAAGAALDSAYLDTTQTLEAGQAYDVIVAGPADGLTAQVNEVDLTPLPTGQARVRIVHAAQNAGAVDVGVANGANLVEGLEEGSSSEYQIVDAGTIEAQVRAAGEQTPLLEAPLEVMEGMTYDVVALGNAQDDSFGLLTMMATSAARQGEVATPAASPEAGTGAEPVVGTPLPVEAPASPTTDPAVATPVGVTPVAATPENAEDATGDATDDATDAVDNAVDETTDEVEEVATEAPAA